MKRKRNPVKVLGVCEDGKPMVGGSFKMADTYGFPLADSILAVESEFGGHVSMVDYCVSAVAAGWQVAKAVDTIQVALRDLGRPVLDDATTGRLLAIGK